MAMVEAATQTRAPARWQDYLQLLKPRVMSLVVFTGLTGLICANTPIHPVLGAVFAIFAGFYYWFEKMWGVKYREWLGALHFWITFIGVNLIFFPQHFLGMQGMPRRYIDYPEAFTLWNEVASWGYVVAGVGVIVFLVMLIESAVRRRKADANPWGEGATTLEWTLPSPPPYHQFNELPHIRAEGGH